METKKCAECGKDLPLIYFSGNSTRKDGLEALCRQCQTASIKKTLSYMKIQNKRIKKHRHGLYIEQKERRGIMSKLEDLYCQLEACEQCLAEDIEDNDSAGVDFYTRAIRSIRDRIDTLEAEGDE